MKESPNKSSLSYGNTHRPWQMFSDSYYETVSVRKMAAAKNYKFLFRNKLVSLDASSIVLCLTLFLQAEFRKTKGAVKFHLLFDHDGYFPVYIYIPGSKKLDATISRRTPFLSALWSRRIGATTTRNYGVSGRRIAFSLSLA
jgi:hypothetical protein